MAFYKNLIVLTNTGRQARACGTVKLMTAGNVLKIALSAHLDGQAGAGEYRLLLADSEGAMEDFPLGKTGRLQLNAEMKNRFNLARPIACCVADVGRGYVFLAAMGGTNGDSRYACLFEEYFKTREYYLPETRGGIPKGIEIIEVLRDEPKPVRQAPSAFEERPAVPVAPEPPEEQPSAQPEPMRPAPPLPEERPAAPVAPEPPEEIPTPSEEEEEGDAVEIPLAPVPEEEPAIFAGASEQPSSPLHSVSSPPPAPDRNREPDRNRDSVLPEHSQPPCQPVEDAILHEDTTICDLLEEEQKVVECENYYDADYENKLRMRGVARYYRPFVPTVPDYETYRFAGRGAGILSKETEEKVEQISRLLDEAGEQGSEKRSFYDTVADQLNKLFNDYGAEEYLEKLITDSRWAKVNYGGGEDFYTVGVIYNDKTPAYICYGIPGEYSEVPPQELEGYCEWLPRDMETPRSKGYWMMYQDAATGEAVSIDR